MPMTFLGKFLRRFGLPKPEERLSILEKDLEESFLEHAFLISEHEGRIYALQRKTAILAAYRRNPAHFMRNFLASAREQRAALLSGGSNGLSTDIRPWKPDDILRHMQTGPSTR
jgi:hypothetical protein